MAKPPLCVAILWHMHQPEYGNVQTGEIYLPWTRFHAAKDYYDMAILAAADPALRTTFNVVPSLLDQLEAYGTGRARETYALLTLRDAADLDERERLFLLRGFFQLPWGSMLAPYPRYRELLALRGEADAQGEFRSGLRRYREADYRDLQAWFNLSWCGSELRRRPGVAALFARGSGFTESDKRLLIETQFQFAGEIVPLYRRLAEQGSIELAVSPYYHPILPLLCDTRSAREQTPGVALPASPFACPRDARVQIDAARSRFAALFGGPPAGMWPSEGAVSDAAAGLAREAGFSWLASDDGLLGHSLGKAGDGFGPVPAARKFSAYRLGSAGPAFFFRDHGLSDLIGFTYARWRPEDAAADFLNRLSEIQAALPDDGRHRVVPVILDGENAWEHYPDNGIGFLGGLYRGLVESPHLRPVTFSEYLALEAHREPLATLAAGSWIGGNLTTWIGHPEKNRAWELLAAARAFLAARLGGAPDPAVEPAAREMLIAEGSDWFWWYGDDHASENAAEFDALFRSHVKNVYRLAGGVEPPELDLPIKRLAAHTPFRTPVRTLSPRIDGRVTDYFEWLAAGHALASRGGSMHRSERVLEAVYFGYDRRRLYLRLDAAAGPGGFPAGSSVRVRIVGPRQLDLRLEPGPDGPWRARWEGAALAAPEFAGDRILELAIPLDDLGLAGPGELRFFVTVEAGERELERFPASDVLVVPVDPGGLDPSEWVV